MQAMKWMSGAAALWLLAGCAAAPPKVIDHASADAIIATLEESAAVNRDVAARRAEEAKRELSQALLPADVSAVAAPVRFDVAVNNMPAQAFFRGLVHDTPHNMVVHPDVSGLVSLTLKQVTLPEVMDVMREVYGYDYARSGNIYRIYPDVLRTEVFQIDYLHVLRRGTSEMQVSAGKVSDTRGNGGGGGNNNYNGSDGGEGNVGSGDAGANGGQRGGQVAVVGSSVRTQNHSDFWTELADTLKLLVGNDGSEVVVTPQAGLVVVRAKPDTLRAVRNYLQEAQLTLTRQVILEAKILEVTLDEGFQAGIDWHTFGIDAGGTFKPVTTVDRDGNSTTTRGSNNTVASELMFNGAATLFNPLGSKFAFNFAFNDFEGMIQLLETQGTVHVLSSPRIATVNNQKAVIKVGSDEFFVTDRSTSTITAGSAINVNDSVTLTPFFSGIALDVTPQISAEGDVTLHVHPTVSEVREQRKDIGTETVPLAASSIRESDSIVRARSGQVIVIGGLMQTTSTDNDAGIPLLGRLPLIGYAFSQKQQRGRKSELVILLRPIVVDDAAQQRQLQDSLERVKKLEQLLGKEG